MVNTRVTKGAVIPESHHTYHTDKNSNKKSIFGFLARLTNLAQRSLRDLAPRHHSRAQRRREGGGKAFKISGLCTGGRRDEVSMATPQSFNSHSKLILNHAFMATAIVTNHVHGI